jgi:hypothetical protein
MSGQITSLGRNPSLQLLRGISNPISGFRDGSRDFYATIPVPRKTKAPFLLGTVDCFGGCSIGVHHFNTLTENMRKGKSSKHFDILEYIHT